MRAASRGCAAIGGSSVAPARRRCSVANTSPRCASIHGAMNVAPASRAAASRRERIERRDADHRPVERHGQALHRGQADAQAGERARAGRHGQQIDALARDAGLIERARRFRQAGARRACATASPGTSASSGRRRVDRDAAAAGGRVEGENEHGECSAIVYSTTRLFESRPCPQPRIPSLVRDRRPARS